jgi:hypothetical protein
MYDGDRSGAACATMKPQLWATRLGVVVVLRRRGIPSGSREYEAMDLSSLASLGKVAGLGGIAIGLVVVLVRPIIDRVSSVPAAERAPMLRFVAMGAFGIGALGIVAWLISGLSNTSVTAGMGGVAAGRDVSGNTITLAPQGTGPPPAATPAAKPP